jgi:hypothetical protein
LVRIKKFGRVFEVILNLIFEVILKSFWGDPENILPKTILIPDISDLNRSFRSILQKPPRAQPRGQQVDLDGLQDCCRVLDVYVPSQTERRRGRVLEGLHLRERQD